jgi:hypothetical protein
MIRTAKPKPCRVCRDPFTPRPMQTVCGMACAQEYARQKRETAERKAKRESTKGDRKRKEELKTLPQLLKEAQREFNRFIRLRDVYQPCICCDRPMADVGVGGAADAGHYRSVGSAPHLRFNEDNCHSQSKHCNRWGSGRAVDYRLGLIQRIGLARVEALEADQSSPNWTRDDVRAIRDKYRAACKELEKR